MKRHVQCAEQQVSRSNLTKYCACHEKWHCKISKKISKNRWNVISNAGPIRPWSEHDPRMIRAWKRKPQPASQVRLLCEVPRSIFYCKIQRFAPDLTLKLSPNTAPATKSATWTSPSTAPATKSDTWTSPSSAPATKSDTWTSPNTAPATKNDSTAVSSSHMKRHFQWCHYPTSPTTAPATKNDTARCQRKSPKTGETSFPMRGRSDHDPTTMIRPWSENDPRMIRAWKRKPQPASQPRLLFELTTSIFYWKIQRFAPNLTFKPSPHTAPATKSDTWTSPSTAPATKSDTWTSPSTAPATKSDTWTSPSTAPATKNDSTAVSSSHMKRHFQCAEQQVSLPNLPKYCTCHEKWHCKMSKKIFKNRWNVISNAGPIRPWSENDPSMKTQTATRLATEVTFRAHHEHFLLKNTTFRAQSYIQTFTTYCACHEKWHLNVTKYCACHEKWHWNFTKYCACHEKWHLNVAKYCACHEKWHLNFTKYCACHEKWHLNFTKYCTCHEKWHLNFTKYCSCHCTVTELYCTLLYLTLLYLTLLYFTLLYLTLFYLTLLYLTLLYLTLLYLTLLYLTLLYLTLLYLTLLYLTLALLDSTLLDLL